MKLKCNWTILHRYILEPSLNPFKAHIELQMSSYVNIKAIKLITLFVGFVQVYKAPGLLPNLSIQPLVTQASVGPRTGLEEHHLTFGATLNKWLAEKLWYLKYRVRFYSGTTWLDFWCILQYQILFIKTGVHFAFEIWKGLTEKADFDFVKFCNVNEWMLEHWSQQGKGTMLQLL